MTRTNRISAALAAALALGACAPTNAPLAVAEGPPPAACPTGPWRDAGLADGADGLPETRGQGRLRACGTPTDDVAAQGALDAYLSGHAEGVAIYCSADNAWQLGRARRNPTLTCPASLAERFAASYAAGLAEAIPPVAGPMGLRPAMSPSFGVGIGGASGFGIGIRF
jgi:hypothetical protein